MRRASCDTRITPPLNSDIASGGDTREGGSEGGGQGDGRTEWTNTHKGSDGATTKMDDRREGTAMGATTVSGNIPYTTSEPHRM